MSYSVRIKGSAAKELARLPRDARARLIEAIDGLGEQPLAGALLSALLKRKDCVGCAAGASAAIGSCTKRWTTSWWR